MLVPLGRSLLVKSNALIRVASGGGRRQGSTRQLLVTLADEEEEEDTVDKKPREKGDKVYWVPHRRTGIYYPKGHEAVMESIPSYAPKLERAYWFRSLEGVEDHGDSVDAFFRHAILDN